MSQIKWMKTTKARNPETFIVGAPQYQWHAFQRDYAQIVHSDFFKRLAGKTQVHSFPINDHLRTRMTHSIEVSQIGRHIGRFFSSKLCVHGKIQPEQLADFSSRLEELTAAACLMHDTGHPPFGHTGAKLLDTLARKFSEDFDDNKQVVRLILNNTWNEKFDPSGPLIASVMKKFEPKDSSYKSETQLLEKNLAELDLTGCRHPASMFMEAADDLAYIAADISDYLRYFMEASEFQEFCGNPAIQNLAKINKVGHDFEFIKGENLFGLLLKTFDSKGKRSDEAIFDFSSNLIKSGLKLIFQNIESFFTNLPEGTSATEIPRMLRKFVEQYKNNNDFNLLYLNCSSEGDIFFKLKKSSYRDHILEIPHVGSQNLLAKKVLTELFDHFGDLIHSDFHKSDIFKMLPLDCKAYILSAHDRSTESSPARVVVDFIAGMTDEYALRMWDMISKPHILSRVS